MILRVPPSRSANWEGRSRQHDTQAVPKVVAVWERYGYQQVAWGFENVGETVRGRLVAMNDPTSILMRFRPDIFLLKDEVRSVLCEVKSEGQGHPNFAVEADSYWAASTYNRMTPPPGSVCYAFVDLISGETNACWAHEIPKPRLIRVPRRPGWEERKARLEEFFPEADFDDWEWRGGSGTPYFLLKKTSPAFQPLDRFIEWEVGTHKPMCVPAAFLT